MHLRQLNRSITCAVSHLTAPSRPPNTITVDDDSNINAIIQVVTTILIIIMAVVFVTCALFFCFHRSLGNECCGVDDGGEDEHDDNGADGRRRRPQAGLSRAVIDTFPTYMYSDVRAHRLANDELECAVCLNQFKDVEILRVLPTCCHVFHPDCIDTWLVSRATCPVCRADIGSMSNLTEHGDIANILGISDIDGDNNWDEVEQSPAVQIRVATPDSSRRTCSHPKSHSTGHSPMWTAQETDRFTLRLPEEVTRYRLATGARWPIGGLVSSPRSWYRHPTNIVGWCRYNGIYVIRNNNYHRFKTGNNNNHHLDCLGEPSNVPVPWSASPRSDGPVDYSTLLNVQQ